MTIFFQNEAAKTIEFKGNLPKYSNFRSVLQVIEKSSNVKFEVKGEISYREYIKKSGEFDSFPQDLKTSVDSRCNVK